MEPQIQYAKTSDGVSIAYYAIGEGPALLYLNMPSSHLEAEWQIDPLRMAFTDAARRSTFVRLDPRGCGLSVHHAYSVTYSGTPAVKIIENHLGRACVKLERDIIVQAAPPPPGAPGAAPQPVQPSGTPPGRAERRRTSRRK